MRFACSVVSFGIVVSFLWCELDGWNGEEPAGGFESLVFALGEVELRGDQVGETANSLVDSYLGGLPEGGLLRVFVEEEAGVVKRGVHGRVLSRRRRTTRRRR